MPPPAELALGLRNQVANVRLILGVPIVACYQLPVYCDIMTNTNNPLFVLPSTGSVSIDEIIDGCPIKYTHTNHPINPNSVFTFKKETHHFHDDRVELPGIELYQIFFYRADMTTMAIWEYTDLHKRENDLQKLVTYRS